MNTERVKQEGALRLAIGLLLRVGTWLSASVLAIGLGLSLLFPGRFSSVIHAGVLLLIALPFARVVLSCLFFLKARDWVFAGFTGTVLAVLVAGLLLG